MPDFGDRLKTLRKKTGLTQPELAELIGVHETTIRRWENQGDIPKLEGIKALSKALNVPESDLLNDPPPNNSGDWIITFKIADCNFNKEEIDLSGNIQNLAQITATPKACVFTIEADWHMLATKQGLKKLFDRILKESYPAIRGNGVALGGIQKGEEKS